MNQQILPDDPIEPMICHMNGIRTVLLCALVVAGYAPANAELTVRGRVVNQEDRPLAGASVELRPELDFHQQGLRLLAGRGPAKPVVRARSDRRGAFELTAPEIGLWRITVGSDGYIPMTRALRPLLHEETLADVRLLHAEALTVTVESGGSKVADVLVDAGALRDFGLWRRAMDEGGWWPARRSALTGDDGRATLLRAAGEQPMVGALKAGDAQRSPDVVAGVAGDAVTLEIAPSPGRTLKLLDAGGKPAAGVLLLDMSSRPSARAWRPPSCP